jgi:UPF0716 protein FxsA
VIGFLLFLLILALPLVELYVFVQVWQSVGGLMAIGLLVLLSVVGVWLVKREGTNVWRRFNAQVADGKVPANEVVDGTLVLLAGALLIFPGFVSDAVGLFLLLPPVRAGIRFLIVRGIVGRLQRAAPIRVVRWSSQGAGYAQRWMGSDDRDVIDITEADPFEPDGFQPDDGPTTPRGELGR